MRKSIGINRFNTINRAVAWLAFAIALCTYWLTIAPTASYWDCPEYIASAYNLEPGHPPGNPIFMLAARFCINFAPDPAHAALAVNAMSGLLSALTILFLFFSISIFARRIVPIHNDRIPVHKAMTITGCSLAGSLIYAWSDTFWFSAVEAEVYSFASFTTALMVWLMLKWAESQSHSQCNRYIVLLAYLTGISIAVHLLNLLCIPALILIWAYRRNPSMRLLKTLMWILISFVVIGVILFGAIPLSLKLVQILELIAVNRAGMPYNSGFLIFIAIFAIFATIALTFAIKKSHSGLETAIWGVILMMLGFFSYGVIIIRSNANPTMNQGAPSDPFSFASYFEREQYGAHPLLYGRTPYSPLLRREVLTTDSSGAITSVSYNDVVKNKKRPRYRRYTPTATYDMRSRLADRGDTINNSIIEKTGHGYILADHAFEYAYAPELNMLLPRVFSSDRNQIEAYGNWCGMYPETMDSVEASTAIDRDGNLVGRLNMSTGKRERDRYPKPTLRQNAEFLAKYQIGYMYLRYFMWNFAGRQNDVPSQGQVDAGNFITGINPIDNAMLGDQSMLPAELGKDNKGRNAYFLLPLLLGVAGIIYQWRCGRRGRHDFNIVLTLFIMTGVAIVVYLNQTTGEPRERDYSFAESFYAFSIWCGLGVAAIASALGRLPGLSCRRTTCAAIATATGCGISLLILTENFDDHDRSGQYAARDFAINTLESLEPQAILFVNGDNYTFPLWYAQEVEHIRRDVRVINLAYLATDWYVKQLMTQAYESSPLPLTMSLKDIAYGAHSINNIPSNATDTLKATEALRTFYSTQNPDRFPTRNIRLSTPDSTVAPVIDISRISGGKSYLSLDRLVALDIIATNAAQGWKRPIYWGGGTVIPDFMGMDPYLEQTGYAYRLTPDPYAHKRMNTEKTRDIVTGRFRWGGAERSGKVYFDPNSGRMVSEMRGVLIKLAGSLIESGNMSEARRILLLADDNLPDQAWHYCTIAKGYELHNQGAEIGNLMAITGKALNDSALYNRGMGILEKQIRRGAEYLRYIHKLPAGLKQTVSTNARNERSTFYAPVEAYLTNGGSLDRLEGIKGIDLDAERRRWILSRTYRELIGNARRFKPYAEISAKDYALLPIEERRADTAFHILINHYLESGGEIPTLKATKEFEDFDFSRVDKINACVTARKRQLPQPRH